MRYGQKLLKLLNQLTMPTESTYEEPDVRRRNSPTRHRETGSRSGAADESLYIAKFTEYLLDKSLNELSNAAKMKKAAGHRLEGREFFPMPRQMLGWFQNRKPK